MWALLLAIVVVGIALAVVSSARQALRAERESTARQCDGCTPCCHPCRRQHP